MGSIKIDVGGVNLLNDPIRNKGTAFSMEERDQFSLHGLLPHVVEDIDLQMQRVHEQLEQLQKPINKYIYLLQLLDSNETLFFRTLMDDPAKYLPLVYTPTVGEARETFGHIFRNPRGLYISINDKDRFFTTDI